MNWENKYHQLENAIRKADSLLELKKLVGASQEQNAESIKRLAEIEMLYNKFGFVENMPSWVQDRYRHLQIEQRNYENEYY